MPLTWCSWTALRISTCAAGMRCWPPISCSFPSLRKISAPRACGPCIRRSTREAVESAAALLGHLVTRYDGRLLVRKTYERQLRQLYGASVLHTVIPEASAFKVSLACRQPVTCYAPRSKAALLTSQLGCEIVERIRQRTSEKKIA